MGAGASVDEHPEVVVAKKRVETLESELAALKATVAALQSSAGADGGAAPATPARSPAGGVTSPSDASGLGVSPPGVVGSASDDCDLFIVHFNDVYNIEPREKEPVGGAARFARYVKAARSDGLDGNGRRPLVLFSGDALNPSLMSTVTRGHQMVPVLNEIGVHVALVGNHDFDFGVENLEKFMGGCKFPWLLSNCDDPTTGRPLANALREVKLDWQGVKIGIMGLIEKEWLATLATLTEEQTAYRDFVEVANELAAKLRGDGCQLIIALTHFRLPNDQRLAREAVGVDLILGGHDHDYVIEVVNGVTLCKSGTDFREGTEIRVKLPPGDGQSSPIPKPTVSTTRFEINYDLAEDPATRDVVSKYMATMGASMDQIVGTTEVELDAVFAHIRTRETNLGNLVCDIMRDAIGCDVVLLNSGTLRADCVFPPGHLKMRDLVNLVPMQDETMMLGVTGAQLLRALENSVSQFPRLEGRFAQVSGLKFQFDPRKDAGSRVVHGSVVVGGAPLDLEKEYTLGTKGYLVNDKDGYKFSDCRVIKDAELCPVIPTMVRNFFRMLATLNGFAHNEYLAQVYGSKWRGVVNDVQEDKFSANPKVEGRIVAVEMDHAAIDAHEEEERAHESEALHKEFDLCIVHFNDVYNIEPRKEGSEPVGGAARFIHHVKSLAHLNPLVLFSGDAFNPSTMSTVTRGKQMPPILNEIGVHASVLGNHDLDHSSERFEELAKECKFPWLLSNCIDNATGKPLCGLRDRLVIEWEGKKVGLVGLIEQEWLATLSAIREDEVTYSDFVEVGSRIAKELKEGDGCDIVIALTHMRVPNDKRLAAEAEGIDLVLGGHDHHYEIVEVNGVTVCKSGTDFREGTLIKVHLNEGGAKPTVATERFEINYDEPEDDTGRRIVEEYYSVLASKMDAIIGQTSVPLDALFSHIRTRETNVGNFVCDLNRIVLGADVYLLNSGTLRADCVFPAGNIRMRDITALVPMADQSVLLECTGAALLAALENGVSQYPRLEGRFPQVSGVKFEFDPARPAGSRVIEGSVFVGGKPLDPEATLKVGCKHYMALGKDGYTSFKGCKLLVDDEDGPCLPTIIRLYFLKLSAVAGFLEVGKSPQRFASFWKTKAVIEVARAGAGERDGATDGVIADDGVTSISPQVEGRIVARGVTYTD